MVAEIRPAQLSVAVGGVSVTKHWVRISGSVEMSGTGGVLSAMTTFWFWVAVLPWPSEYVQWTVKIPGAV